MGSPNCSCGYYDAAAGRLWTDSIIVYFNESQSVPTDIFQLQDYTNGAEKSWNAYFRQGASPNNVAIGQNTYHDVVTNTSVTNSSLQLYVNPATPEHVVVGGGIETLRRDIRYGSFRTWMRSPQPYPKGTALSFHMRYNTTQGLELNMQNTNDPSTAWLSNLQADEFPDRIFGVNYTVMAKRSLPDHLANPWNFYEQRVEWTDSGLAFVAGPNTTRSLDSGVSHFFDTPTSFQLKHWSIGDEYAMEGPPINQRVMAEVGWVRSFFNTSSMTTQQRQVFDSSCQVSQACSVDDFTLRGASSFPPSALAKWEPSRANWSAIWPAVAICGFSLCFTIIVTLNALFRRYVLERGVKQLAGHGHASPVYEGSPGSSDSDLKNGREVGESVTQRDDVSSETGTAFSEPSTSASGAASLSRRADRSEKGTLVDSTPAHTRPPSERKLQLNDLDLTLRDRCEPSTSEKSPDNSKQTTPPDSLRDERIASKDFIPAMPGEHDYDNGLHYHQNIPTGGLLGDDLQRIEAQDSRGNACEIITETDQVQLNQEKHSEKTVSKDGTHVVTQEVKPAAAPPPAKQRIDYLAGLVAVCSLLVTVIHFALTFVPALVFPSGYAHYPSEVWARKIIGPYIFNQVWVGLFFATSTRFLVMKYLKTGSLANIAEKVVSRIPRLFAPIGAMVLLEYFLIDCGALTYLQYLPSVTWSTWPYTVEFQNFGIFINEFLELVYLVPNAVPRIVFNYCIGVLWTIPVQLQGSWQALLGAIVIVECKTSYKRFGYYGVCILYNWYVQDWGAFFWFGLLLTDLDVVYNYRPWLYARPFVYYPLLIFSIACGLAGLTNDLISAWTPINYAAIEFNFHPDLPTGLPIVQSPDNAFPAYYAPTIKHLLFCIGFQAVVELSTTVQKALSNRFLVLVFPHIFTIYLLHGFIFWSVGAAVCVAFNSMGLPYWATALLTAVICYGILALVVPFITPVMEVLGKDGAANAWRMANAKVPVVKWRPTLHPYPKKTLEGRPEATDRHENGTDVENSPDEVRQIEREIAHENAEFIERAIEEEDLGRLELIANMRRSKLDQALRED